MSKAGNTRLNILRKAFALVYRNGYQATSIDNIIAETQVTKGAFFYHFKSKDEMGVAMIREIMYPGMQQSILQPLSDTVDPVGEIYQMMKGVLYNHFFEAKYGCPAMNLIEEMAPLNDLFKKELAKQVKQFQRSIEKNIIRAIGSGKLPASVQPEQVSLFIATGYSGVRNMGKIYGKSCYDTYLKSLKTYLENLK